MGINGGRGRTMLGLWAGSAAPQHVTNHVAFATTLADVIRPANYRGDAIDAYASLSAAVSRSDCPSGGDEPVAFRASVSRGRSDEPDALRQGSASRDFKRQCVERTILRQPRVRASSSAARSSRLPMPVRRFASSTQRNRTSATPPQV